MSYCTHDGEQWAEMLAAIMFLFRFVFLNKKTDSLDTFCGCDIYLLQVR